MKKFLLCATFAATIMAGASKAQAQPTKRPLTKQPAQPAFQVQGQTCEERADHLLEMLRQTSNVPQQFLQQAEATHDECQRQANCCTRVAELEQKVHALTTLLNECADDMLDCPRPPRNVSAGMCELMCTRSGGTWDGANCGCPAGKVRRGACQCVTPPRTPPPPPPPPPQGNICPRGTELVGQRAPTDQDCDRAPDGSDNCINHHNPGQHDFDGDGAGFLCDPDDLAPFIVRLTTVEQRLLNLPNVPGDQLPTEIRQWIIEHWNELQALWDRLDELEDADEAHGQRLTTLEDSIRELGRKLDREIARIDRALLAIRREITRERRRNDADDVRDAEHRRDIDRALKLRMRGLRTSASGTYIAAHYLAGGEFAAVIGLTDILSMTAWFDAGVGGLEGRNGGYFAFGLPLSLEFGGNKSVRFGLDIGGLYIQRFEVEDKTPSFIFYGAYVEPALVVGNRGEEGGVSFRFAARLFAGDADEPNAPHALQGGGSLLLGAAWDF